MRNPEIEKAAREALNGILGQSVSDRKEYGGMIYFQDGKYHANPPRTQGYGNTVNVGQWETNRGCPEGSTAVAFYHTHPNLSAGGLQMKYNEFSPEDKTLAQDLRLDAYLGTLDGSFLMYDPLKDKVFPLVGRLKNTVS
jgi:proteasome lid subunit RPN8/RPN11